MSKARKRPVKNGLVNPPVSGGPTKALNESLHNYLTGPPERLEHDLAVPNVTEERHRNAVDLIRACRKVGLWRLKQGQLSEEAGWYIGELADELAHAICVLIGGGDILLASRLPGIVDELSRAIQKYGRKMSARARAHHRIHQILKKHSARDLLAMLSTLHPHWEKILHVTNRSTIERMSEKDLRTLLLSKERWTTWRAGKRVEELRDHRISEIIANIVAMREAEAPIINKFVEHLLQGRLWGLKPDKAGLSRGATYVNCPWHGKRHLPARDNVNGWMKLIIPFLKAITGGDASRLTVFEKMLAARQHVFAGDRLADDKPEYIWNQVENRIRKAWETMKPRRSKRDFQKPA